MTLDEAVAQIVAQAPSLTEADVRALSSCSAGELEAIVFAYSERGVPRSAWDVVLRVLAVVSSVASLVLPLSSAIQSVYDLKELA